MAKDLPYYKFEPGEYLTGNIQCCSLGAQGLFVNVQSIYWQRGCDLTKKQMYKMLKNDAFLDELIAEGIIKIKADKVEIDYLLKQYNVRCAISEVNTKNGAKGAQAREVNKLTAKPNSELSIEAQSDVEWMKQMCAKHGTKTIDKWIATFDKHLVGKRNHVSIIKYKEHFDNWMAKQDKKSTKLPSAIV